MNILVIFTGGTIGTIEKSGYLSTDESTRYTLLNNYINTDGDITFTTSSPYTILSENLSSNEINLLQKEISSNFSAGYDGIIVTHGTDTLQYTSCAIEYSFSDCSIPIVFVSSAYPLDNPKANGHINFEAAVEFIKQSKSGGVYVSYKNENEANANIHIPSKILQHAEFRSDIYSIDNKPYAIYNGKIEYSNSEYLPSNALGYVPYRENSGILVIDSHPGDNYNYCLDSVEAVIIKPYHSGTLCTSSQKFQNFCKNIMQRNIPFFAVNITDGISYESTKLFDNLSIIPLTHSTYISAYVKLWAAISLKKDIVEFMN